MYTITLLICNPQVATSSSESDDDEDDDDGLLEPTGYNEPLYEQNLGDLDELHDEEESHRVDDSNIEQLHRNKQER